MVERTVKGKSGRVDVVAVIAWASAKIGSQLRPRGGSGAPLLVIGWDWGANRNGVWFRLIGNKRVYRKLPKHCCHPAEEVDV